jgi:Secretory lipase
VTTPPAPADNAPAGDAFYTPPVPLPPGQPGDPVYQRLLDNPTAVLADASSCWLVLYQSQDVHGNAIATSGIIALPQTAPPAGGYPVISWAHGTVGVADLCAPSRDQPDSLAHPMNAYPQTLLNTLLQNGYVVAMTDYEGLGTTDRTHPYLLGPSEAYAILDIVRAAQRLFGPQISSQVAIVGHSQGGQGALFAGAYAPSWAPDLTLNGVAAIAPANHNLPLLQAGAALAGTNPGFAFTPLFLCGAIAADPTIDPEQVLTPDTFATYWPQVQQRCRAGLSLADSWGGIAGTAQFADGYLTTPNDDQQRFNNQVAAMNPAVMIPAQVRVTQAADDERVLANPAPYPGTDTLITELTSANPAPGAITYQRYPAGTVTPDPVLGIHFATINYDTPALLTWLATCFG